MKNLVALMVVLGLMVCIGCGKETKKKSSVQAVHPAAQGRGTRCKAVGVEACGGEARRIEAGGGKARGNQAGGDKAR